MRARLTTLAFLALTLSAGLVRPVAAQDIRGLTLRTTDKFATGKSGIVDLVKQAEGPGYVVKVDLSSGAEDLAGDAFKGKSLVVWAVDMDGTRHNLGQLGDKGVLENAKTDYVVAKLFVSAESDAKATQPAGDRIYELTLRSVTETDKAPAAAAAASSSSSTTSTTAASTTATTSTTATAAMTKTEKAASTTTSSSTTATDKAHPQTLPTTGEPWQDLTVLTLVSLLLLAGGWRLARVKA